MPEVIDLIDSTPPQPSQYQPPPSAQPPLSPLLPPSRTGPASSPNFLSDDFNSSLFVYDDAERSVKKRKITPPCESVFPSAPQASKKTSQHIASDYSLFTFSDDIDLPALPSINTTTTATATATTTIGTTTKATTSTSRTKTYTWNGEESDPIVFTSSAPERTTTRDRKQARLGQKGSSTTATTTTTTTNPVPPSVITINDDDDHGGGGDEIEDWSDPFRALPEDSLDKFLDDDPRPSLKPSYSERTAALLADLRSRDDDDIKRNNKKTQPLSKSSTRKPGNFEFDDYFDSDDYSDPDSLLPDRPEGRPVEASSKTKRNSKVNNAGEKAAKTKQREAAREQRQRDKEAEKERKRLQKEEKAREKQLAADIAEVNKSKTHKKESMPEMIVDMANTFEGGSVGNQVVEYMKNLGAEHSFFQSAIPNVVKWRRKKRSNYNEDAARWEPCQPYIATENHVLCMLIASEFVDMVICDPLSSRTADDTETLDGHVQKLKTTYPNCKPIYLIEGLTTWMRRNKNSRNRAYQAEVLRQINNTTTESDPASTTSSTAATQGKRGRKPKTSKKPEDTPLVADDTIEDALLQLQVSHNCLIYHTSSAGETAEWIKNFSEHISTIPYRHVQMDNYDGAAFCMETGQVKTGEDKMDTFVKMLQEVNRVTAPMAYGIANRYPSAVDLLDGMKRHGPTVLENVRKSANKNGALTDSRIGPAVSKRLYKVFMGLDETSADI